MASWLEFHNMGVISARTLKQVICYKNRVRKMPNKWLQMEIKRAVKPVLSLAW